MALKRHPDLASRFAGALYPIIKDALHDFFEVHLRRTINHPQEYLRVVLNLLEGILYHESFKSTFEESVLPAQWLRNNAEALSSKKNKEESLTNAETKLLHLELLCELWKAFADSLEDEFEKEDLLLKGVEELKKNSRS